MEWDGSMLYAVAGRLIMITGLVFLLLSNVMIDALWSMKIEKRLKALEEKQNKSSWIFKIDTYKPSRTGKGNYPFGKQIMDELKKDLQKKVKRK
jgi:hypothetical protein